jgi:hypothetical protein
VSTEQQRFVASNAVSLAQALFHEEPGFAIYVGESPGVSSCCTTNPCATAAGRSDVTLWRFMWRQIPATGRREVRVTQVIEHVRRKNVSPRCEPLTFPVRIAPNLSTPRSASGRPGARRGRDRARAAAVAA